MPRKTKTVYDRITETTTKITECETNLNSLKNQLSLLLKEKDSLEMHQLWDYVKSNNLSIDDVKRIHKK